MVRQIKTRLNNQPHNTSSQLMSAIAERPRFNVHAIKKPLNHKYITFSPLLIGVDNSQLGKAKELFLTSTKTSKMSRIVESTMTLIFAMSQIKLIWSLSFPDWISALHLSCRVPLKWHFIAL